MFESTVYDVVKEDPNEKYCLELFDKKYPE